MHAATCRANCLFDLQGVRRRMAVCSSSTGKRSPCHPPLYAAGRAAGERLGDGWHGQHCRTESTRHSHRPGRAHGGRCCGVCHQHCRSAPVPAGRVPANSTCTREASTVCVLHIPPCTASLDLSKQAQRTVLCAPLLTLPLPRLMPHRHAAAGAGDPCTGGAA